MTNNEGNPEFLIPVVLGALSVLIGIVFTLFFLAVLMTEEDIPDFLVWI